MDGQRALIYSRIRENRLNPGDSDVTRALRTAGSDAADAQQLASAGTFFRLPFNGSKLLAPIATDLTTMQFMQLGWVKFRAGTTLHCRLGGSDLGDGVHHRHGGEHLRHSDGAQQLGSSAAAARLRPVRSRLRDRHRNFLNSAYMGWLSWIVFGLLAGAVARVVVPGKHNIGCLPTIAVGIVGALIGGAHRPGRARPQGAVRFRCRAVRARGDRRDRPAAARSSRCPGAQRRW